jgi:hypothetical protein
MKMKVKRLTRERVKKSTKLSVESRTTNESDLTVATKKPVGYWTKEKCALEAEKYKTRMDFKYNSRHSYEHSCRKGWLDEICQHMDEILKPLGYWKHSKDNCASEALKYNTRKEFGKFSSGAYHASLANGWLDEICRHMDGVDEHPLEI